MRFRWLALFPLLYAAAFVAIASRLVGGDALGPFVSWQKILVRVLAAVGCFAAVSAFQRGDHLRRAWFALGTGALIILLRDLLRLLVPAFQTAEAGSREQLILSALGILSNVALLAGVWMLAHAWKMAAISLPGGRAGAALVLLVTIVLAVAVAGPEALRNAQAVKAGDSGALILLVSAVVDIISFSLITPLLLAAVSLRGGLFSWPWAFITASQLAWLLYDATGTLAPFLAPGVAPGGFPLADVFRGLAENFLCSAGLAQLFVIQQVRRSAA
jgi:hypothetical protein